MKIRGFEKTTLNNYPGKIASIVFFPKCNYRCPACHARQIVEGNGFVTEKYFLSYLDSRKGWIDAVVLCGGEPTLEPELVFFIEELKKRGLAVKLDTNGKNWAKLKDLLERRTVDYVAMDVKGPLQLYPALTGMEFVDERDDILKGMNLATHFPGYEFRTTAFPVIRNKQEFQASFMTPEEIGETARMIYDYTGSNEHRYFLQPFVPKQGGLLDSRLESFPETPKGLLEEMKTQARKHLPNTRIR